MVISLKQRKIKIEPRIKWQLGLLTIGFYITNIRFCFSYLDKAIPDAVIAIRNSDLCSRNSNHGSRQGQNKNP